MIVGPAWNYRLRTSPHSALQTQKTPPLLLRPPRDLTERSRVRLEPIIHKKFNLTSSRSRNTQFCTDPFPLSFFAPDLFSFFPTPNSGSTPCFWPLQLHYRNVDQKQTGTHIETLELRRERGRMDHPCFHSVEFTRD